MHKSRASGRRASKRCTAVPNIRGFWGAFAQSRKVPIGFDISVRPSVRIYQSPRLPLDGFSWNLTLKTLIKNCRGNPNWEITDTNMAGWDIVVVSRGTKSPKKRCTSENVSGCWGSRGRVNITRTRHNAVLYVHWLLRFNRTCFVLSFRCRWILEHLWHLALVSVYTHSAFLWLTIRIRKLITKVCTQIWTYNIQIINYTIVNSFIHSFIHSLIHSSLCLS